MKQSLILVFIASVLASCVTINIYFPAAAADKAADKIIDDVWQIKPGSSSSPTPPADAPKSAPKDAPAAPEAK